MVNNIAGLAKVEESSVAFTYDMQPGFKPFDRMAGVFAVPTKFGVAGAGVFRFGDELYNENVVTVGFANTFGLASIGLRANYIQYKAAPFGSKGLFTISFGGIAKLSEKIFVGAHILNINQPDISRSEKEKLPTTMALGVAAQLTSQTLVSAEVEKELSNSVKWKAGIEYKPLSKFTARTGVNINPDAVFFGVGFKSAHVCLDYAYRHNFIFGSRHQATVGYMLKKKK
jgi:hypothetical protein